MTRVPEVKKECNLHKENIFGSDAITELSDSVNQLTKNKITRVQNGILKFRLALVQFTK